MLLSDSMGGCANGHTFHASDLMEESAPQEAVRKIISENGNVDIIVHNLGGSLGLDDPMAPLSDWQTLWKFNVGIAIEINNIVVPAMMKEKWGRIVMVSSIDSDSKKGAPAYGTAKAYLNSYIKHVAWRLAEHGIVLCGILPGPILAEGNSWERRLQENPKRVNRFISQHMPAGRLGMPSDLCPFVLLMASDLNRWGVGSLLELDGGITT